MSPAIGLDRPQPVQARAKATVEGILEAAAALLAERGASGFTMSDVAERASVAIGSLYRWFPTHASLVRTLAERHLTAGRAAAVTELTSGGGTKAQRLDAALRGYLAGAEDPLVVEIMRAIRAEPTLRALDRADTAANAATLARLAGLPPESAVGLGLVIDLAGHLMVDVAERAPSERAELIDAFVALARRVV